MSRAGGGAPFGPRLGAADRAGAQAIVGAVLAAAAFAVGGHARPGGEADERELVIVAVGLRVFEGAAVDDVGGGVLEGSVEGEGREVVDGGGFAPKVEGEFAGEEEDVGEGLVVEGGLRVGGGGVEGQEGSEEEG